MCHSPPAVRARPGFVTPCLVDFFIELPPDPLDRGDSKIVAGFCCQDCPDFGTKSFRLESVDVVRGKIIHGDL